MDWLYHNSATALLILGSALIAFGLFGDTIRGWMKRKDGRRRRCPKCWYDLRHTDGLRCPECGHTAKRERSFRKGRRRKRWIALGALFMLASHPIDRIPAAMQHGPAAFAPDWLLVAVLPWYDEELFSPVGIYRNAWPFAELDSRIEAKELGWLGEWLWLKRAFAGDGKRPLHTEAWYTTYGLRIEQAIREKRLDPIPIQAQLEHISPIIRTAAQPNWPIGERFFMLPSVNASLIKHPLHYTIRRADTDEILYTEIAWSTTKDEGYLINYSDDQYPSRTCTIGVLPPGWNEIPLVYTFHRVEFRENNITQPAIGEEVARVNRTLSVNVTGTPNDYVAMIDDASIVSFIRAACFAIYVPESSELIIDPVIHGELDFGLMTDYIQIAWRAEILLHGDVVASGRIDGGLGVDYGYFNNQRLVVALEGDLDRLNAAVQASEPGLSVRLVPDPVLAHGTKLPAIIGETIELPLHRLPEYDENQQASIRDAIEANRFNHLRAIVYPINSPNWTLEVDQRLLVVAIFNPSQLNRQSGELGPTIEAECTIDLATDDGRHIESDEEDWLVLRMPGLSFVDLVVRDVDDETIRDLTHVRLRFPDSVYGDEPPTNTELLIPILPPDTPVPWKWKVADDGE